MSSSKSQTPGPAPDAPSGDETSNQMQRTWAREPVVEPEPAPGTSPIPKPVLEVGPEFSVSEPEPEREPEPEFAPGKCSPESHPHPHPQLPPLSPEEFRVYNRLAEQMELFHDHFRTTWATLHAACTTNRRPHGMSLKQFINEGLRLVRYLTAHHNIEETYLYPLLARKMPQFRQGGSPPSSPSSLSSSVAFTGKKKGGKSGKGGGNDCELLRQHRLIHEGMDVFEGYLRACQNRETELELSVLKEKMDSWGDVLMKHLDEEVDELRAETMRKYWTLDEMRAIPI